MKRWQREFEWNSSTFTLLQTNLEWVGGYLYLEIIGERIRLNTYLFSVKHHFGGSTGDECNTCNVEISVKHILIEYPMFNVNRKLLMSHNLTHILND